MPAKGFLNSEQKERLQKAVREGECRRFREHALMLLLQNDGKTYEEIANFIGCGYRTVAYWCVHGDPDKLDSLRDKREQGNYRKATEQYIRTLAEIFCSKIWGCNKPRSVDAVRTSPRPATSRIQTPLRSSTSDFQANG